jgi:cytochrome c553
MRVTRLLALAAFGWALAAGSGTAQQRIAGEFDLQAALETCAACHGDHGTPISEEIPVLWGQQFYYLYVQLKDFKAGRRANEIMQPIAEQFDKDQMKALAEYFAGKTWPKIEAAKPDLSEAHVEQLINDGQCAGCHNTFMGDSRLPRVAGQQYPYLKKTLLELRDNVRQNAAAMQALMRTYTDQDLDDLARYLAAL